MVCLDLIWEISVRNYFQTAQNRAADLHSGGHRFWVCQRTNWSGGLQIGSLQLHWGPTVWGLTVSCHRFLSGGLQSRTTDFGSVAPNNRAFTGAYSLGRRPTVSLDYSLGAHSLSPPILDLLVQTPIALRAYSLGQPDLGLFHQTPVH